MNKLFGWHHSIVIILFLAASCSSPDPRLSECQQFINLKRETDERTRELSNNLQTKNKQKILEVADRFESTAAKISNLTIEDPKLLKLTASWTQFYLAQARATRAYLTAFDRVDIQVAKQTIQKIQQLDRTELQLVTEINNYCQEKPNN